MTNAATLASLAVSGALNADTNGNVGLGVVPNAWASGMKVLQFGNGTSIGSLAATYALFAQNYYYDGTNNIYLTTNRASLYAQDSGSHKWFNAPSGTAGTNVTLTQVMTLNASGYLGLGETNPVADIDISKASGDVITRYRNGTGTGIVGVRSDNAFTEVRAVSNHGIQFSTNNTERARIDSSGNLLVGTTSAGGKIVVAQTASSTNAILIDIQSTTTTFNRFTFQGSSVGSISYNGSSTVYATSSDYRLKENIQPMTGALAKVAALKPCTYTWKADGSDGEGFIAHELAEVFPDAVAGEKDAIETYTDEEGNEQTRPAYQGVDTSFLVATLTAAIQELKAIVDAQAAEIAALKGNA